LIETNLLSGTTYKNRKVVEQMAEIKFTGFQDKNSNNIYEGSELLAKSIDGVLTRYKVRWSIYRADWIGDNPNETYDLSSGLFIESEIVNT
jgi:hypothetical protein